MRVIDLQRFQSTQSLPQSLVEGDGVRYPASDIGRTFLPPMNARWPLRGPLFPKERYDAEVAPLRASLPRNFNWAFHINTPFRANLTPVQNQGQCGSCWAVSSATCIGDKWAVATRKDAVVLSAQDVCQCTCANSSLGCDCTDTGGIPQDAALTAATQGLVSNQCWPYVCANDSARSNASGSAPAQCVSQSCPRWYVQPTSICQALVPKKSGATAADIKSVDDIDIPATLHLIQQSIRDTGPVVCGFQVPSDLMVPDFPTSPNYILRATGSVQGGHAVVIVGWGHDAQGQLYWTIRNSWGPNWGNQGYFNVYAYDPKYPANNLGFDIPVLNTAQNYRAVMMSQLSRASLGALQVSDADLVGFGGVYLCRIDLGRSPASATSHRVGLHLGASWSTAQKAAVGAAVAVVVGLLGWWFWRKRQSSHQ